MKTTTLVKTLATLALMSISLQSNAIGKNTKPMTFEKKTHSLSLSYGAPSILFPIGKTFGPINFGYEYQLTRMFGVGGLISYSSAKANTETYYDNGSPLFNYAWHGSYYFVGAHGTVYWMNRSNWALYSGLSVGYMKVTLGVDLTDIQYRYRVPSIDVSASGPMVVIDLFGAKYKVSKEVSIFSEFGLLTKGIVCGGIQYSFPSPGYK